MESFKLQVSKSRYQKDSDIRTSFGGFGREEGFCGVLENLICEWEFRGDVRILCAQAAYAGRNCSQVSLRIDGKTSLFHGLDFVGQGPAADAQCLGGFRAVVVFLLQGL